MGSTILRDPSFAVYVLLSALMIARMSLTVRDHSYSRTHVRVQVEGAANTRSLGSTILVEHFARRPLGNIILVE